MSNLIRLIYASKATNPPTENYTGIQADVGGILMQARKNNPRLKIGGVLYFSNNYFFQCLEGGQEEVNQLYNKIAEDTRHENVQSLSVRRVNSRLFANWSMKYVALEENVKKLITENGYSTFVPYEFDDNMIDKMLNLFVIVSDITDKPDQNYPQRAIATEKQKRGFWRRLFSRTKSEMA